MRLPILISLCLFTAGFAAPADDAIPPIVRAGFEAFTAKGAEGAWDAWGLDGSQRSVGSKEQFGAADKEKFISAASLMTSAYGKPLGFELIRSYELGSSYRTLYVLWRFEKKPVFCMFVCYRSQQEWKILNFFFSSDPRAFLPEELSGMLPPPPAK
jgi:hypothetical protein